MVYLGMAVSVIWMLIFFLEERGAEGILLWIAASVLVVFAWWVVGLGWILIADIAHNVQRIKESTVDSWEKEAERSMQVEMADNLRAVRKLLEKQTCIEE